MANNNPTPRASRPPRVTKKIKNVHEKDLPHVAVGPSQTPALPDGALCTQFRLVLEDIERLGQPNGGDDAGNDQQHKAHKHNDRHQQKGDKRWQIVFEAVEVGFKLRACALGK